MNIPYTIATETKTHAYLIHVCDDAPPTTDTELTEEDLPRIGIQGGFAIRSIMIYEDKAYAFGIGSATQITYCPFCGKKLSGPQDSS